MFGVLLFIGSFGVLYWNEGRTDISLIAKTATQIESTTANTNASLNDKLVSTTGALKTVELVGDGKFLNPGAYLAVERTVEMYAWIEKTESTTKKNLGGSETTETTYDYTKEWVKTVPDSSDFEDSAEHQNPVKGLEDYETTATSATVGVYTVRPKALTLPDAEPIQLTAANTSLSGGAVLSDETYIFVPYTEKSKDTAPQLGDLRVSYRVVQSGFEGTVFGKLAGTKIEPYANDDGDSLYRVFEGTRDEAIATLHSEFTIMTWVLRVVGFLMMWIGLSAVFGPISVLLDIVPIFGSLSRALVGAVTFVVALIVSVVTILVSMILHSLVAIVIALLVAVAAVGAVFTYWKKKKKNPEVSLPSTQS